MTEHNQPEKEFRAGSIKAAVWCKQVTQDGKTITQYSVTIKKRYHDRQTGKFKDSSTFFPDDLPRLELVARKAFEYAVLKESEENFGGAAAE